MDVCGCVLSYLTIYSRLIMLDTDRRGTGELSLEFMWREMSSRSFSTALRLVRLLRATSTTDALYSLNSYTGYEYQ